MSEIKALEWIDAKEPRTSPRWRAESVLGEYMIILNLRESEYWSPQLGGLHVAWNTLEAAQAAAQSDFEARIRSSLVERKGEPVPAAWREAVQEFVDRVERGEVRSKRTYAKFKELLSASPSPVDSRDAREVSTGVLNDMLLARAPDCRWTIASILKERGLNYRQRLDYMRAALSAALAAKEQQPSPLPPSPKPAVVSEGGEE